MSAHRYWRLDQWVVISGGLWENTELRLYVGATDVTALATYTATPAFNRVASTLQDNALDTPCTWNTDSATLFTYKLVADFGGSPQDVNGVKIASYDTNSRFPKNFRLSWSDDNIAFTVVGTCPDQPYPGNNAYGPVIVFGPPPAQTLLPNGVATLEAFGALTISQAAPPPLQTIVASGIASTEAHGTAVLSSSFTLAPSGIASREAFGATKVLAVQSIAASGIASVETFGAPGALPGAVTLNVGGIASLQAFGVTFINAETIISPAGIASAEQIGRFSRVRLPADQDIGVEAIDTEEAFGMPMLFFEARTGPEWLLSRQPPKWGRRRDQ